MAGYILVGTLAAFGFLAVAWCLWGLFLPKTGGVMLCMDGADAHFLVRRYLWLRGLGLLNCPLLVLDRSLQDPEREWLKSRGVEICSREECLARLGIGEKCVDGTGNGDPPGDHCWGGLPEL